MTTRNQRQRKKLHLAEFQELGFLVNWQFAEGTSIETIDETVDRFIAEVIQPNGLAYEGSGYLHWEGLVCLEKIGKCDESHRQLVQKWLEQNKLQQIEISELFDIWWDYPKKTHNILSILQGGLSALFNNHFHLYFNNLFTSLISFQNILDLPQEKCIFLKNYSF